MLYAFTLFYTGFYFSKSRKSIKMGNISLAFLLYMNDFIFI